MAFLNNLGDIISVAADHVVEQSNELSNMTEQFENYSDKELSEIANNPGNTKRIIAARMALSKRKG